jgi:hypothetical protein
MIRQVNRSAESKDRYSSFTSRSVPQQFIRSASSAEKTVMTQPPLCRAGCSYRRLANRFDNRSNAAYIVNRQFKYAHPRLAIQTIVIFGGSSAVVRIRTGTWRSARRDPSAMARSSPKFGRVTITPSMGSRLRLDKSPQRRDSSRVSTAPYLLSSG